MVGSNRYIRERERVVMEGGGRLGLAHQSAKITSSSGGQMSSYSIFERQSVCVCVRTVACRRCVLRGSIRSDGTSLVAYMQLTEQRGACGRGC